jgi:hypothetical protein
MKTFTRAVGIYSLFFSFLLHSTVYAAEDPVQNIRITGEGSYLEIRYDLLPAVPNGRYTVTLELSDDGGRSYAVVPRIIVGDLGKDISPGFNKRIIWRIERSSPYREIDTERYEVRISVKRQGFNRNILYVIAGAVVTGGGALAYFLFGGNGDDEPGFPQPPGRPQN